MAKPATTWEGRRALTDNPATSPQTYTAAARSLMEKDLLADAAVFFTRANDVEGLKELIDIAVKDGNFFLFQSAVSSLGPEAVESGQLEALKTAAEKNGRALYASRAAKYLADHF